QYGLVIYGLSSIHDAKINNNIGLLKTQQYYLIPNRMLSVRVGKRNIQKKRTLRKVISSSLIFIR
ncbi:hypothetical protein, partial [Leyella stercorea]|uniref:hypothetical protein n=1 Tax=Leyella stercorea TaxID=363265 RepID=UPI00242E8281